MKIAVDIDEVLYGWNSIARYLLREHRQAFYEKDSINTYSWRNNDDNDWLFSLGVEVYGLFRYGKPITGAIDGMRSLSALGHDLELVSHRPVNAMHDTNDWISFMEFPIMNRIILNNSEPKEQASSADILIDDKPSNIIAWTDTGRPAVMFGWLYDALHPADKAFTSLHWNLIHRARTWPETIDIFIEEGWTT